MSDTDTNVIIIKGRFSSSYFRRQVEYQNTDWQFIQFSDTIHGGTFISDHVEIMAGDSNGGIVYVRFGNNASEAEQLESSESMEYKNCCVAGIWVMFDTDGDTLEIKAWDDPSKWYVPTKEVMERSVEKKSIGRSNYL